MTEEASSAEGQREKLREAIWRLTEWRGSAAVVEELLCAVDRYADARCRRKHGAIPEGVHVSVSTDPDHERLVEVTLTGDSPHYPVKLLPVGSYALGVQSGELVEVSLVDAAVGAGVVSPTDVTEEPSDVHHITADEVVRDEAPTEPTEPYGSRTWVVAGKEITRTWGPTKVCKGCDLELPIEEFHFDRTLRDGHRSKCRRCADKAEKSTDSAPPGEVW